VLHVDDGIRVALGATRGGVLRLVLKQQARMILLGGTIGTGGRDLIGRCYVEPVIWVKPHDPQFCAEFGHVVLIALLASIVPALSAMRTDPHVASRSG
jgi:hypothetical protein